MAVNLDGQTQVAQLQKSLSQIEEQKFRQNLLENTTNLFVDLILIQEKLEIASMNIEMARNTLNYEETKPSRDSRMPVLILNAKLQLEKAIQEEFKFRSEMVHRKSKFKHLIGLDQKTNFGLDKDAKTKTINDSLEAFIKIAEKNSLQLRAIRLEQAKAKYIHKVIKSEQLPAVNLNAKTHYARLADRAGFG